MDDLATHGIQVSFGEELAFRLTDAFLNDVFHMEFNRQPIHPAVTRLLQSLPTIYVHRNVPTRVALGAENVATVRTCFSDILYIFI